MSLWRAGLVCLLPHPLCVCVLLGLDSSQGLLLFSGLMPVSSQLILLMFHIFLAAQSRASCLLLTDLSSYSRDYHSDIHGSVHLFTAGCRGRPDLLRLLAAGSVLPAVHLAAALVYASEQGWVLYASMTYWGWGTSHGRPRLPVFIPAGVWE